MEPGKSDGSGANGVMSVGDAIEHICGVVGVAGVLGVLPGVVTWTLVVSSLPLNSRDLFGTRPYRTADVIVGKKENKIELEITIKCWFSILSWTIH